jgi:hypothetical protein
VPEVTEGERFTTEAQRGEAFDLAHAEVRNQRFVLVGKRQKGFWQARGLNGERRTANASVRFSR